MLATQITTTAANAPQQQTLDNSPATLNSPIKMERRDSTTSESSLEHLDLGRTPKKLNSHTSVTSTPHVAAVNSTADAPTAAPDASELAAGLEKHTSAAAARLHDSDDTNDYDEDDSADERQQQSAAARSQRHHKRRSSGRLDKRASVQLEYNADNPNSLRKKFRFNRSGLDAVVNSLTNNESGFVDASCLSQYLNASAVSAVSTSAAGQQPQTASPHTSASASHSSSASSSPHGAGADGGINSASSPESGIGEREDMKYVCPICEVVSATPHEFTNHIRCHNYSSGDTENFTCRICSKVLSSASSLDRHVLVHTGERPFNCKYCHLTFTTNGNMHRHMRTHKQHQHNHHHRRNSNGTKNNISHSHSHSNGSSTTTAAGNTLSGGGGGGGGGPSSNLQLTNGIASSEGVKTASTAVLSALMAAAAKATTTTAIATAAATEVAAANGKRLNGSGVESYESDGGCSTDSSSAISQSSNNHNHTNNNNNNNNVKTNNNNRNNNNNNNNNNNTLAHNFKRKNSDHLDADDDIASLKRRVKTTINNNNNNTIIVASEENRLAATGAHAGTADMPCAADAVDDAAEQQSSTALLDCPVCHAVDFESLLSLAAHMDAEHAEIPAKCRHCDVVFRSHRQLNVHPCSHRPRIVPGFKDLTFVDFSSEKFPLIAKSLCEQSLRTAVSSQRYECPKCGRAFPCISALEMHVDDCAAEALQQQQLKSTQDAFAMLLNNRKRRSLSESSAGADDMDEEEQHGRNEFLRQVYLKNKPLSSPQHSNDEPTDAAIKFEMDGEQQHLMSQQSHDSKDLADIQSILNMTSSSSTSNFLKNFEQSVNTPSSNYSLDKDEEEAQDAFTSEFRKMKLRGEFPCKLCTAVFPNLRALKGHNRVHLSAAGPAGPFRCNMCPYSICDKAALVRHMRSHNGDRPYECAVCNYAFTTKANCERHLRNRHAKTSRDEVKRAIIYHPSEDSSCDDATKKLHMFSSPDFDDDGDFSYQHQQPKDRSTPVSHLKDMLTVTDGAATKPMKIQVKRLDQLIDKNSGSFSEHFDDAPAEQEVHAVESTAPMDLSMDVLDLSKKPTFKSTAPKDATTRSATPPAAPLLPEIGSTGKSAAEVADIDLSKEFSMSQQQQFMNEATAPYLQFYRNLLFPPLNPFFLQNSFLPNNLGELQKIAPLMSRMFGGAAGAGPLPNMDAQKQNANSAPLAGSVMLPQVSPLMPDKSGSNSLCSPAAGAMSSMLPKALPSPAPLTATLNIPRHSHIPSTVLPGGPVKMVIKNGVLMPKQKQRRYRTERPFACEHCSARFTLRSNMERHVKQQHPQYYAQRQRSGHHIMRGRGASSGAAINNITHLQAAFAQAHNNAPGTLGQQNTISEQVKYAILAQQLKARKDTDLLQQALAHGSSSVTANPMLLGATPGTLPQLPNGQQFSFAHMNSSNANGSPMEDDEPKLIIDEDEDDDVEEIADDNDEEEEEDGMLNESVSEEPLPTPLEEVQPKAAESNVVAKKVAETILEQAIKAGQNSASSLTKPEPAAATAIAAPPANTMKSLIAQAESVGKSLKEVASSAFKDESPDLVPVSKLVDNATNNAVSFNSYFRPSSDVVNHMEQSDEEGLVASGSASESNNSGTEDIATAAEPKKKSAYSLAPNRVSCPYCQRMFPWSSSLRRHILTHTGQKPFKCSHCPLLFTTKSNCDRHLLRKHGNVESAMSVYVPTEDVSEPIPVPKSVEEIEHQQRQREDEERKRKTAQAQLERERREKEQRQQQQQQQQQHQQLQLQLQQQQEQEQQLLRQLAVAQFSQLNVAAADSSPKPEANSSTSSSSELPYKCHLCESSFGERLLCLEHIKVQHAQDFALLLAKGAIDTEAEPSPMHLLDDDERRPGEENGSSRGKYPDYSNRKVICAFCVRRFWSTEDLRRHMRTHSGERPFQCEICLRKFTLKHSMLRHMKKHSSRHHNGLASGDLSAAGNSGSDFSDDEQSAPTNTNSSNIGANTSLLLNAMRAPKIQELLSKANGRLGGEQKENIADEPCNSQTDLIGKLLGISDQGILNMLLTSADEAAKLLGVEK